MAVKQGDFIEVEYTGRLKEDNSVFDTTDKKLAKESGIFSENITYGPVIICVGKGHILKGLEKEFIGKSPGKFSVELAAENAFGKKNAGLIELVQQKKFVEHKIQPVPGLQVNVDGTLGVVRRVGGGRVLVDFNHPLAGKGVVYDVNIKRIVSDKKEQVKGLLSVLMKLEPVDVKIENEQAVIMIKKELPDNVKDHISKELCSMVGLKKAEFKKEEEKKDKNPESKSKESEKVSKTPENKAQQ